MRFEGVIERFFSRMPERRMSDVVDQRQGFSQFGIQSQGGRQGARNLRDLEGVGKAAAEVVSRHGSRQASKDLRFSSQAAKRAGVQDAGSIARERSAIGMGRLRVDTTRELAARGTGNGDPRR